MKEGWAALRHLLTGDPAVRLFLGLLLVTDLLFLALNFAPAPPSLRDGRLLLEFDQGFPEIFQYIKAFWIALLLATLALWQRRPGYLPWAALFLYFLLDDALSIHESLGIQWLGLGERFPGLSHEAQELVFVLLVMGPAVALIGTVFWRGDPIHRSATRPLLLLTAVLAFFGVVVDKIHGMVGWSEAINIFVGTIEDWGEMVVMSLIVAYTLALYLRRGQVAGRPASRRSPPPWQI